MRRELSWLCGCGLVWLVFGTLLLTLDVGPIKNFAFVDFYDYYFAADAVSSGVSPYDASWALTQAQAAGVPTLTGSPFIYPAWFAATLRPLLLLPPLAAAVVAFLLSGAVGIAAAKKLLQDRHPAWLMAVVLFPPALFTLFVGQINLVLFALLIVAWAWREERPLVSGASLGFAIALKLAPIVLLAPLLRAGRWKNLGAVGVTIALCMVVGELAVPGSTHTYLFTVLPKVTNLTSFHGHPVNQGASALLVRTFIETQWSTPVSVLSIDGVRIINTGLTAVLIAIATTRSWCRKTVEEALDWSAFIALFLIISPLAWESLLVLLLLPFALLWRERPRLAWVLGLCWVLAALPRLLNDFAHNPEDYPLLLRCPPLASMGLVSSAIIFIVALWPRRAIQYANDPR